MHRVSVANLWCCLLEKCDICNWVGSTSCHRGEQYCILYSQFTSYLCLQKSRGCFLNISYKSWESLVTLRCHLIVASYSEQMSLKNKILLLFEQTYLKKNEVPYMEMSRDNAQKREESLYMEKSRNNDQKRCVYMY